MGAVISGLAAVFAVVTVIAGTTAWDAATRPPTAAERAAAAMTAMASRWRTWPAGRIFPASLDYTTGLLNTERASRVGIGTSYRCAAALDGAAADLAHRSGCSAAVRATYIDAFDGVVYTTGLLAFPSVKQARVFADGLATRPLPAGLRALAFPGTAAAPFDDAARQAETHQQQGPFVVMTVAGYADGRPAAATGQARPAAFGAASQLATVVLGALQRPVTVTCANTQWSC